MGLFAVGLELDTIFEILVDTAVHIDADQPAVESGAVMGTLEVAVFVRTYDIGSNFGLAHESGLFVAEFQLPVLLCESTGAECEGTQGQQYFFHIERCIICLRKREYLGKPEESEYKSDHAYDDADLGHVLGLHKTGGCRDGIRRG